MAPRPDVTILIYSLGGGGAERVAVTLCNALVEQNKRVHLIVLDRNGAYWDLLSPRVEIFDLRCNRVWKALFPLTRYLYTHRPKAMLCFMTKINALGILANLLAFKRTRMIISEHAVYSYFGQGQQGFKKLLVPVLPLLYHFADRLICVSQGVADDLSAFVSLPPQKVVIIYNPTVRKELTRLKDEPIDHPWLMPGQPPVMLAVGAFRPEKNYDLLLHAFAGVDKKYNARLLVLGDGPGRSALEQLARDLGITDRIDLPGFKNNPFSYMARSTFFVMCSDTEGLPGALIEALACGAPVVATDCPGGMREILGDQHYGLLVPKQNKKELTAAMEHILHNVEAHREKTRSFQHHKMQEFTLEAITPRYLKILGFT